jgi:hypothetical protein
MGDVMPRLLDLFAIPHRAPTAASAEADVDWAVRLARETEKPVALVVRPGLFA